MGQPDPWHGLRRYTDARVGQGRAGVSQTTREWLAFQLDHARARDAIWQAVDFAPLQQRIEALVDGPGCCQLSSACADRASYLQRPDLGRQLSSASGQQLEQLAKQHKDATESPFDLAIVVADGLSAKAIECNAWPMLQHLLSQLQADAQSWHLAPISLVQQGRVAVGDEIGQRLQADAVLLLVGERPGLSSPDSLGLYLTWHPRVGCTDERRNCISNVRPQGLDYRQAALRALYLLSEARRRRLSGVELKEQAEQAAPQALGSNFLLAGKTKS
ncbi:Ethanolamine ammonia-lyase light chain [Ferrimonas marina]|uniref:Ethanolamine ammonia-lyase small subunit n=1 Tax=Ferrimonas marina TaxID=299255 RepID=A0A1M5YDV0_9GAMM|nr:Ethanolamine ammonia-lyase light chain [Ferrimonas marina]